MSRLTDRPGKAFYLAALRHEGGAFRQALPTDGPAGELAGRLSAEVPSCPGWTTADLVGHVGGMYRWVTGHVVRGVTNPPESRAPEDPSRRPEDATELLAWWDAAYRALVEALDRLDPDYPAWNPFPQPKVALAWHRRMAHETSVHRWDAQMAAGRPEPIEAKLAADGVTERLDSLLPAVHGARPHDPTGTVRLTATDTEQDWLVRLRSPGFTVLDTATMSEDKHPVAAVAAGSASDLALALWGRIGFDLTDTSGDERLLDELLA